MEPLIRFLLEIGMMALVVARVAAPELRANDAQASRPRRSDSAPARAPAFYIQEDVTEERSVRGAKP
jgi:hypothetical protein